MVTTNVADVDATTTVIRATLNLFVLLAGLRSLLDSLTLTTAAYLYPRMEDFSYVTRAFIKYFARIAS